MGCSACDTENPPGSRFCNGCGAPLSLVCPGCDHANPPASRFCNTCGQALGATAPPTAPSAVETASREALTGERKQVTILFADVVGSTALIHGLDDEEAQRLLDGAVQVMVVAVHRYDGTVSRRMGDGLMAMFGAPVAHEDHALRACYAALAMLDAIRALAAAAPGEYGAAIQIRVGLNSGGVIVRLISDDRHTDYTAMGETVHLAARMEQLAAPGTIVLSPATLALVEGWVETRPLGPMPVKGLDEPIEIHELRGAGTARSRLQASAARGLTPFVGRDDERAATERALDRARSGQGQVVALVGEPGVGKSRLVYEVTQAASAAGWLVLQGGALSYGQATSYLPVVDLVKRCCRIEPGDDVETMRARVVNRVMVLDRSAESIVPPLLALLDVPIEDGTWVTLDPPLRRRATLDAVERLLLRESQRQPLLLVLEDLHWIDTETQALLDELVETVSTARMLLLVNHRPEYTHGWGGRSVYTQVRIDPLESASAEQLLRSQLGEAPTLDPLRCLLIERTSGNPLFLEESVRSLVETGVLIGERGDYTLTRDVREVSVPATVQVILAARIDRLDPEEKRLLQTAAVIGKDVPFVLLHATADLSGEMLPAALSSLRAAELLYPVSLYPEAEYTFKHALTHEVAYGSLLHERRKTIHARVADAIERVYGSRLAEHVGRLAYHALRAEDWVRGVTHARMAGHKSRDRWAIQDATSWYRQALDGLAHLPENRQTRELAIDYLNVGFMQAHLGEFSKAVPHAEEGLRIATASDDPFALAVACNIAGRVYLERGDVRQAIPLIEQGMKHSRAASLRYPLAWATSSLGAAQMMAGHLATGVQLLEEARDIGTADGPLKVEALWAVWLGEAYLRHGRIADARTEVASALAHAIAHHQRGHQAYALRTQGDIAAHCDRPDLSEAEAHFHEALTLAEEMGMRPLQARCHLGLGTLYRRVGRLDEARAELSTAVAMLREMGMAYWLPEAEAALAEVSE